MADFLTIMHDCKDFNTWKPAFDADAANRKAAGLTDLFVLRGSAAPNRIALMFRVSDRAQAEAMVTSDKLRETMQAAGVVGAPIIRFRHGEYTHKDSATYLSISCRISGIDRFRTGFAMDKADRVAAGMTDLAILQAVDDPDEILLLWAINDEARVTQMLQSPALAKHQVENCGVVSDPVVRFWTR